MVRPLALSLESSDDGIAPQRLLLESHLSQLDIPAHQIPENKKHLHYILPIGIQFNPIFLLFLDIKIRPFILLAVFFRPSYSPHIFLLIVNTLINTPNDLTHIHILITHAQISLEKIRIHNTAGNPHCHRTDGQIALSFHHGNSYPRTGKTQQLLFHILRNRPVIHILNILPIYTESGHPFLTVTSQSRCQIHGSRTFRPVKSPNSLRHPSVIIYGLTAVTPARRHRNN